MPPMLAAIFTFAGLLRRVSQITRRRMSYPLTIRSK
ncbi:hypothetical protein EBL_c12920 [Shimwellia blattae DSM 4481 = NBRC 105725]|uniref:Uncharacterized protein n=1 Tax=Shimwellia blattae (strain ATCC 29907 / DSM 4481 / JCM 1650 / NBRC 105725 / CDC 9005-74) TaxID=630626 RepID=I2B791_SHIBC|nr:hypothetical protein EBL_c12920 [Shimwellia blattae DSM 4481 = NBRC 105725]